MSRNQKFFKYFTNPSLESKVQVLKEENEAKIPSSEIIIEKKFDIDTQSFSSTKEDAEGMKSIVEKSVKEILKKKKIKKKLKEI